SRHVRNQQDVIDQLQKTTSFLDAVIDNLPGMLFVKSFPDSRFVLFNRAGEELLGRRREELLGRTDLDFYPREQAEFFRARGIRRIVSPGGEPAHAAYLRRMGFAPVAPAALPGLYQLDVG
ncbi:MAG TPA: PAS domain-containing protein, partial [Longimicrobium sp.]|nr:PAS domain-containing protein [Longimicrobium sp.]